MKPFSALVRPPGVSFLKAISSHPQKNGINYAKALNQHQSYLAPEDSLPDSTFVEDMAFIYGKKAFLCSTKEKSRQKELDSVAKVLKDYFEIQQLEPFLDGGDILNTPEIVFAGLSNRTDSKAVSFLSKQISKKVVPVKVAEGLHLKSSVSYLGKNILLINPDRVDPGPFKNFKWIKVEEKDSYAANCLAVKNRVLMPKGYQGVREKIWQHGFETIELEMGEF